MDKAIICKLRIPSANKGKNVKIKTGPSKITNAEIITEITITPREIFLC